MWHSHWFQRTAKSKRSTWFSERGRRCWQGKRTEAWSGRTFSWFPVVRDARPGSTGRRRDLLWKDGTANCPRKLNLQTKRQKRQRGVPLLRHVQWLRVPQRISFKLAVMVYRCVRGLGPAYLADALQPVARIPGRQRLRSSSTSALDVPSTRLSTVGDRAFPVAAARTWNRLPAEVTSLSNSLQTFKTKLKSHLFVASFHNFQSVIMSVKCRHFFRFDFNAI